MNKKENEYVEPVRRPWISVGEKQLSVLIKMNDMMIKEPTFPQELIGAAKRTQAQLMHEFIKRN